MTGIGGIGKSRLSWEFEKYIDGLAPTRGGTGAAVWPTATGSPSGRWPRWCADGPASSRTRTTEHRTGKLRAALSEHVPDAEERRFVEPRLSQLLGLEARATGDQENLFSAWRIFFERLADTAPTILVFEDLHWADSSLLDFIEYLLDWSARPSVFILTLARPGADRASPDMGLRPSAASRRSSWSRCRRRRGGPPRRAVRRACPDDLAARSSTARRAPVLRGRDGPHAPRPRAPGAAKGRYRPTGPIETLEVPATLQALIAARLDGLDARGAPGPAGRIRPGPDLHASRAAGAERDCRAGAGADPGALVRKEMVSLANDPHVAGARAVRLPPGPRQAGRLRHAGPKGSAPPAYRRGRLPHPRPWRRR